MTAAAPASGPPAGRVLALAGGVGGAKLAQGLAAVLPPERLTVLVNTGDDFEHLGLHVSPDLDTVTYTLAGLANPETGWGLAAESWAFLDQVQRLGGPDWFRLGDRDLATHVLRTHRLRTGESLSAITADLTRRLGVAAAVVPMSDQPVRTLVLTADAGTLGFQDYFVRRRCAPAVTGFRFEGAAAARPAPGILELLAAPDMAAVILCPSNPWVSIGPILAVPGLADALRQSRAPVVAVSPIVAGRALKGPAAKMMAELGLPPTALAVARHYGDLLDGFVVDTADAALLPEVRALGPAVAALPAVMGDAANRARLAAAVLAFAATLPAG